jgi:hypothetical protein
LPTYRLRLAGAHESGLKVWRQRRLGLDPFSADRMLEGESRGVEELTLEAEITRDSVDWVSRNGELDRCEMDADLMRPAGLEADSQERMAREELHDVEVGDSIARRCSVERDAGRVGAVASDRRLDAPAARARPTLHEREILALDLARPQKPLQAAVSLVRTRYHEEARGVAIEPVHDSGSLGLRPTRNRMAQKAVDERARRVPGRGVDDEAGRLVDDEQVLVLIRDAKIEILELECGPPTLRYLDLEPLTAREPMALCARRTVDAHALLAQQALGRGA